MNNVVQLFKQEKIVGLSDPDTIVILAVTDILASHADLTLTIKAISGHLDALDYIVDALSELRHPSPVQAGGETESRKFDECYARSVPIERRPAGASVFHNI